MSNGNLNRAGEMTADDILVAMQTRPRLYTRFIELLSRAWDEGSYDSWCSFRDGEAPSPNPYRESPYA